MKTFGSRAEVWHGTAKKTSGGLEKKFSSKTNGVKLFRVKSILPLKKKKIRKIWLFCQER